VLSIYEWQSQHHMPQRRNMLALVRCESSVHIRPNDGEGGSGTLKSSVGGLPSTRQRESTDRSEGRAFSLWDSTCERWEPMVITSGIEGFEVA
jgi:hypothetical protein